MLQKTRPTERLVELKVKALTIGDTKSHKGRSPGTSRLFSAARSLVFVLAKRILRLRRAWMEGRCWFTLGRSQFAAWECLRELDAGLG